MLYGIHTFLERKKIMEQFFQTLISWATNTGIKVIIALILLFVSFKLINLFAKKISKRCEKKNLDKTIAKALIYASKIVLKCIVVIALIGYLGIDTSAITALIASLGLCVGLAVNGTVSNLAGGVLILVTRPFKADDYIEAQGVSGTVVDILITHTKIVTPDNKVIHIPNGPLSNGNVINYSEKDTRRVDLVFTFDCTTDIEKAKALVNEVFAADERILKDPAPFVRVGGKGDAGLELTARAWVNTADYWAVYFDSFEAVKTTFDASGISFTANQLEIKIKKD